MKHQAVNVLASFGSLSFVVMIWGTNWLAIKNVLHSSPPLFFTGICLLGGAIAIGAVRLCLGHPRRRDCEGRGSLVAVALLQTAAALGLGLVGLQYLDAGASALIFYTMPLWLVGIEWTIDRQMRLLVDAHIVGDLIVAISQATRCNWLASGFFLQQGRPREQLVFWHASSLPRRHPGARVGLERATS